MGDTSQMTSRAQCPFCSSFLLEPRVCVGNYHPENDGFWYQTCPNHSFANSGGKCPKGFFWRGDFPRVTISPTPLSSASKSGPITNQPANSPLQGMVPQPPPGSACPGRQCQARSKPKPGAKACIHGQRCADCCRADRREGIIQGRCTITGHNTEPFLPFSLTPSKATNPSALTPLPSTPSPLTPTAQSTPLRKASVYAQPLGPFYREQLQGVIEKANSFSTAKDQVQAWTKGVRTNVLVKFWLSHDVGPDSLIVGCATTPFFQPFEHKELVKLAKLDAVEFIEAFHGDHKSWILCSKESPPLIVREKETVYLRLRGTQGLNMPPFDPPMPNQVTETTKSTPKKRKASTELTQVKLEGHAGSNTIGSPEYIVIQDDDDLPRTEQTYNLLGTPAASRVSPSLPSSSSTTSTSQWPYPYVFQMAPKINQITTAQNRPGVTWEAAFRMTLGNGVRYVASTWHNYLSAWRALGMVEQERLVRLGAAEGGEWMPIVTNWLKSDAAKRGAKKARTAS